MRRPRDYDAELEALDYKAKALRQRKISQLGELVIACGADVLPVDVLAGALLAAVTTDTSTQEVWREAGATMFQRKAKRVDRGGPDSDATSSSPVESSTPPPGGGSRPS